MGDIFLIDYSYAMHQYHHSMQLSAVVQGREVPTGGPFGVLRLISRLREASPGAAIYCCTDSKPVDRLSTDPDYKAGRKKVDALWAIDDLVRVAAGKWGACFVTAPGWEADDVIYTIVSRGTKMPGKNRFHIYSKDMDTIDLCDWTTVFQGFSISGGRIVPIERENFIEAHEHPPEGRQVWKALKGKPADNIKGIPRFRSKVAASIAAQYGRDIAAFSRDVASGEVAGSDAKGNAEIAKHVGLVTKNCQLVAHRDVGELMLIEKPDAAGADEALSILGMHSLRGR